MLSDKANLTRNKKKKKKKRIGEGTAMAAWVMNKRLKMSMV